MQGPWSDDVPSGWQIRPLWSEFRRGKTLGNGSEELLSVYRDYGVIPKSSRDDNFNKPSEDLSKYQRVSKGDLVVNKMKAWQGSLGISNHDGIVSPAYFVYKATGTFERRFAHYLLRSKEYADHMAAISSGIRPNQWDLDPAQFATTPLLVPPPAEQRAIADYLDRETVQIDAFIAKNEELITLLTERRAAVASRSMDRGFPDVAVRHMVRLIQTGPFGSQLHAEDYVPGGNPLINPMHMVEGRAVPSTDVAISDEKADELRRHELWTDDLVVARRGELGRSALITKDEVGFLCGTGSMLVRPDSRRVVARYLQLAIGSERSRATLREQSVGSTMENLNAGALSALRVPLPPIDTQREILRELDTSNARIDEALATARQSIDLARERRAALISAAVRGKIDVGVTA